jgi:tetratricopeptide (TPR) repeat protein
MDTDKIIGVTAEEAVQPLVDLIANQIAEAIELDRVKSNPINKMAKLESDQLQKLRAGMTSYFSGEEDRRLVRHALQLLIKELPRLPNHKHIEQDLKNAGERMIEPGNPDEFPYVFDTVQQMLGLETETLTGFYQIGQHLYDDRKVDDALAIFTLLTTLNNLMFDPWLAAGMCRSDRKEWFEAAYCYAMASILRYEDPAPHLYSAECYAELGQVNAAVACLKLGISHLAKNDTVYAATIQYLKKKLNLF